MKSTKTSELRNMTAAELRSQLNENERSLNDMYFRHAVGQLESSAVIRTVRRDIARLKTIIAQMDAS